MGRGWFGAIDRCQRGATDAGAGGPQGRVQAVASKVAWSG